MDAFYQPSYGYDLEPESDDDIIRIDGQESSDEEDQFEGDIAIRKFLREYEQREGTMDDDPDPRDAPMVDNNDEDDLEKELDAELESTVAALEKRRFAKATTKTVSFQTPLSEGTSSGTVSSDAEKRERPEVAEGGDQSARSGEEQYYDDDYYDSDSDGEGEAASKKEKKKKNPVLSNDDLFYDPSIDDDNQNWIDQQRRSQRAETKQKAPNSDAMLDCPACLTTVCIDCQRHDLYDNQFRAMFVQNCTVDADQKINASLPDKRKRKHGRAPAPSASSAEDAFPSVKCTECGTVVGTMDTDEVYHFFNVVASHT